MAREPKKTIDERTKELQDDAAKTLLTICRHVASGGSLIDLCETWDVRYGDMVTWINDDKAKADQYNNALNSRNEWAKEAILLELRRIGMADIRKLYDDDGNLLEVTQWPAEVAKFVSSIEVSELFEGFGKEREHVGFVKKVKLWNKEKALELLGKNISMFNEHHTHSGKLTLEDLIHQSKDDEQS